MRRYSSASGGPRTSTLVPVSRYLPAHDRLTGALIAIDIQAFEPATGGRVSKTST
jgi:hypothetical protein